MLPSAQKIERKIHVKITRKYIISVPSIHSVYFNLTISFPQQALEQSVAMKVN